jgi:diguanylate cyclase (GGDEF)-like protein
MTSEPGGNAPDAADLLAAAAGQRPLRILHVEDTQADRLLTQQMLRMVRPDVVFDSATRLADLTRARTEDADCALVDLSLPDVKGLDTLRRIRELAPDLPIIVLTGLDNVHTGLAALRQGAQDYLVKNTADGVVLDRAIRYAIQRMELERRLRHQALHDPLTGLPNRSLLTDRIAQAQGRARRSQRSVAVLMIDLDGFKEVNDTLGHQQGDALLVAVARRLAGSLRPTDTLCRLGGDEYVVVCDDLPAPADAQSIGERLVAGFTEPFELRDRQVHISASIGIAVNHPDASAGTLLRDADTAMYAAKATQRDIMWFTADLRGQMTDRFAIEQALRDLVRRRSGIDVALEPVVDLSTGVPVMLEALARWTDPERGPVPTGQLLSMAESLGLMPDLDMMVMDRALGEFVDRRRDQPDLRLCVNLAARTLAHRHIVATMHALLDRHGVPPSAMVVELGENALPGPELTRAVQQLRRAGISLALDDFGTGAAALSAFVAFDFDVVKLDRSLLVEAGTGNVRAIALVETLRTAGQRLGAQVIAEGVETLDQLDLCRRLGIELAQGHLWSLPAMSGR